MQTSVMVIYRKDNLDTHERVQGSTTEISSELRTKLVAKCGYAEKNVDYQYSRQEIKGFEMSTYIKAMCNWSAVIHAHQSLT